MITIRHTYGAGSGRRSTPAPPPVPGPGGIGLGDVVEALAKPVAKLAQKAGLLDCLDQQGKLKPHTPCWQRRENWNKVRLGGK